MVQEIPHAEIGPVKALGNPVKMSATPPRLRTAAPALGADTEAILRELGYADGDIAALRERQVV
jgi:crotonobetainyl-CoA:carnitine CoA-transferase CaiB-like acyl-CoA transferase